MLYTVKLRNIATCVYLSITQTPGNNKGMRVITGLGNVWDQIHLSSRPYPDITVHGKTRIFCHHNHAEIAPQVYHSPLTRPQVYHSPLTRPQVYHSPLTRPQVYHSLLTRPQVYHSSLTRPQVYHSPLTRPRAAHGVFSGMGDNAGKGVMMSNVRIDNVRM